jgi:Protein of unknown function (DUF1214)
MQMAFGDSKDDEALFAEWAKFCDTLKEAGKLVFKDANPPTPLHRADGFRFLTQNLGQAFEFALETRNTQYPMFVKFCSPIRKLASDMCDCVYYSAWIDGHSVYRISGKKGTASTWNIGVQGARTLDAYGPGAAKILHEPFGDPPETAIHGDDLVTNWDGTFELYIGGEKQGQNWLPTTPGTRRLFLRQYFDRWDEEPAEYRIERVAMAEPRPVPDPAEVMAAMRWAATFVHDVVEFWPDWNWASDYSASPKHLNRFNFPPTIGKEENDKKIGRFGGQMWWGFKPTEAMIVEFEPAPGYWQLDIGGTFCNSLDFLYRSVSFTPSRTAVDPDGKARFVVSSRDPGYSNWIDNQGFEAGISTYRSVYPKFPEFGVKVVNWEDVPKHMHSDSRKVSKEERREQLRRRFNAIQNRYKI